MKTVKIILAVLLLLALLPASGCVFNQVHSHTALEEEFESLSIESLTSIELRRLPDVEARLNNTTVSLGLLSACMFLFVLAAGIIAIAWKKKFYGALVSGVLVLIPYIWNTSLQNTIISVAKEPTLRRLKSITWYENTSTMSLANLLLFLPMALLLIIGTIDTISYFVKKSKNIPVSATSNVVVDVVTASKESSVDDLKKYKELLDQGIITQEEFDAKKKQLLDL